MNLIIRMSADGARVDSVCVDPTSTTPLNALTAADIVVVGPEEVYNVEVIAHADVMRTLRAEIEPC